MRLVHRRPNFVDVGCRLCQAVAKQGLGIGFFENDGPSFEAARAVELSLYDIVEVSFSGKSGFGVKESILDNGRAESRQGD